MFREVCTFFDESKQELMIAVEFGALDELVRMQLIQDGRDIGTPFSFCAKRLEEDSIYARANNAVLDTVYAENMPEISNFDPILIEST